MILFTIAIVLLLTALLGVTLEKTIFYLPAKELRRRAERGDDIAAHLLQAAQYDGALRFLLVLVTLLAAAGGIVLFNAVAPGVLGALVVALFLGLTFIWQPRVRLTSYEARLAGWCAPGLAWLMHWLEPVLSPLTESLHGFYASRRHTGLFEASDLSELLERQARQRDNRLSSAELQRLHGVLQLSERRIRDILVPAEKVVAVKADDELGPVLVSELHDTGHSYFPVYDGKKTNIVGTLALERIADVKQHGLVRDNIDHYLVYLRSDDTLEQALRAFYETRAYLFIVLDKVGDYAGIVTISAVLQALFGALDHLAFGKFDDPEAVAGRYPSAKKQQR